ncbi:MAG: hypothetical protein C4547_12345 [Phycisphaerales bacterium]|nr:MAG: hypothetical protein C4547_12345 [Phycisphaerales bacterium]
MARPYDTRLIMMVAQRSFETVDLNQFCKLIPIAYVDGVRPTGMDFPNDGEIWWMLTAQTARLAEPGRLTVGTIENAVKYDLTDPTSSRYQVRRDAIHDLEIKDGLGVIELGPDAVDNIQDVVSGEFRMTLPVPPPPTVMLRWRLHVYGPFIATRDVRGDAGDGRQYAFAPANPAEMTVYQIEAAAFEMTTDGLFLNIHERVSMTPHRRSESFDLREVGQGLLLAPGYERILATNPQRLVLEPIDRKLMRYAKQCLTRRKRQMLQELLSELELAVPEATEAQSLTEAIARIRRVSDKQDAALSAVARAMLESGLLGEERIADAERAHAERYVQERTAELQARVEESLVARREELKRVEHDLKEIQARLQKEEARRRAKLEKDLAAERERAADSIAHERREFEKQKAELARQQRMLQQNLEKVTKDLRDAGDEVVNRFLTIAPLLGSFGVVADRASSAVPDAGEVAARPPAAAFELPAFVTATRGGAEAQLSEESVFDRVREVVEKSGFSYRPLDLQRFHLSVKCESMTVLGGPSGTGKSSLPMLYARALLGDEADRGRPGCLMVNINPSWMDTRDLLGHMNTLDRRFYPAESGLFQHLIYAQEEHLSRGGATGLYLTCLDEMNLSQVEHYFSDLMMVLERTGAARAIQCFAPGSAGSDCPFRAWGRITLSPALRIVGTVNFDETTRLLSDRFLDRVNLIRLSSAGLPDLGGGGETFAAVHGRMVTLADFQSWCTDNALPSELGSLLDQMRPLLLEMGCPVSPRVYRAICRFVSSAPPVMAAARAFDVQVAQRIIPRIRSPITRRQFKAFDDLLRVLSQTHAMSFDESIPLLEEIKDAASSRGWDLEE